MLYEVQWRVQVRRPFQWSRQELMGKYRLKAALFTSSASQTSVLQCSHFHRLFCTQTLQWHPGSKTQRMRSEYSIKVPAADGRELRTKHERERVWERTGRGRKHGPRVLPVSPTWEVLWPAGPSPELSNAESTYSKSGLVLIRCTEDLTTNLGKIKVYLKLEEKELFI